MTFLNFKTFTLSSLILLSSTMTIFADSTLNMKAAKAILNPTQGNHVSGVVTFTQVPQGIKVIVDIKGLSLGNHGFHIHEFGDCSAPDAISAGGHFNPTHTTHGSPNTDAHHAGDFGNLMVNDNSTGEVHEEFISHSISLSGDNTILGHGLIVHANEDDLHSQPTGNSGARVACGIIGTMKP